MAHHNSGERLDEKFFEKLTLQVIIKQLLKDYRQNNSSDKIAADQIAKLTLKEVKNHMLRRPNISDMIKTPSEPDMYSLKASGSKKVENAELTNENAELTNENAEHTNETAEPKSTINDDRHIKVENLDKKHSKVPAKKNFIKNDKIEGRPTSLTEIKQSKELLNVKPSGFKSPSPQKNQVQKNQTPGTSNKYQHVISPVAYYIKNSPQVPLLRDVRPTRPLSDNLSIPDVVKKTNDDKGKGKKSVITLPSLAYKSANETQMITIAEKEKLPKSPWATKMSSSLPKPVVIKHVRREMNTTETPPIAHQKDSNTQS